MQNQSFDTMGWLRLGRAPRRGAGALAAALLAWALAGCNGGVTVGSGAAPQLRAVNIAFNASTNFDVYVNGSSTATATNLGYGQSTALQAESTGTIGVKFDAAGTTTAALTATVGLAGGQDYSVFVVQGSSALTTISAAQNGAVVPSGQSQLTIVHTAAGVGSLDFFVTAPTAVLPSTPTQAAVGYAGDNSSVAPLAFTVASGTYRIRATAAGDLSRAIVFDSGPVTFASGANALLALVPVSGSAAAFNLLSLDVDGTVATIADQRVQVRTGNFAPANGSVDTYFDANGASNSVTAPFATLVAQNFATAYQDLLPGAYHASFTVSGQTAELVGSDIALAAATSVSVYAVGIANQAAPNNLKLLTVHDDLRAPAAGMARLRLLQLAPDISNAGTITPVDLVSLDVSGTSPVILQRLIPNLAYLGASAYVNVPPGSYTLALAPAGLATPLLPTNAGVAVSLTAGATTTLVVAGCEFPGSGICGSAATPLQFVQLGN